MTNSPKVNKTILPLIVVYGITTAFLILGKKQLLGWGVDPSVVIVGNLLLFAVSLVSLLLYQRAMSHPTTLGFLRNTYSGLFLKLLVCLIAVIIYILIERERVNKPAIFACVFLYFLYMLLEMRSLMQWNKARRNA
ncbi:MAG: hypothetical protein ABIQ88_19310 [Chitinophagaceae bacterium]